MAFCVECGADGPTLEGLCARDFQKRHRLVRSPDHLDVEQCAHCGSLKLGANWVKAEVEEIILDLVAATVEKDGHVERATYTYDLRPEDPSNIEVTVKALCRVGPWDLVDSFHTKVRLHPGVCPTCSRRQGKFFAGTVQVRADGRPLTEEEVHRAKDIADRSGKGPAEFVSRVEEVAGGFDVLVSTNPFAKKLAKDLARAFGATVGSSAKLHTHREGKAQYRATYVVRLPSYREGDFILWRRKRYRVVGLGDPVRLEESGTGERLRVRLRDLRSAKRVAE